MVDVGMNELLAYEDGYKAGYAEAERKAKAKKPQTNGDKIRSMSDEELAKWMASISSCMRCPVDLSTCQSMYEGKNGECDKILLEWLKAETSE